MPVRNRPRGQQLDLQRGDDGARDFVLHFEDILDVAVVGLRPDVIAVVRADQLCGDADSAARLAHAAFEHVRDAQLLADRGYILGLALEVERRSAGGDAQIR